MNHSQNNKSQITKPEKMTPIEQNLNLVSSAVVQSRAKEKFEKPVVEALPIQQFSSDLKAISTPHQNQHITHLQNQKEKQIQENMRKLVKFFFYRVIFLS